MYVVYDLETTGFDPASCDVIEFAYAAFTDSGQFLRAERLYYYYEGMSWSEEAYAVHQIPLDFLKQHKDKFKENLIKMYSILNNNTVVGFNVKGFDCPFAVTWLSRQGIRGLTFHRIKDVMTSYKPITKRPRIKLVKLEAMVGLTPELIANMTRLWFGEDESGLRAHEASFDVTATALLTFTAVNKKLMTFAYADTKQEEKVTLDYDAEFGQSADTSANEFSVTGEPDGDTLTLSVTVSADSASMILNHVGTIDSTIYGAKTVTGVPITFDTVTGTCRICKPDGVVVANTFDTARDLFRLIGGDQIV